MKSLTIVLVNIRSSWNVGSIMRTCDALGAKLILIGYTPRPVGKTLKMVIKTAIGAEKTVDWQGFQSHQEALTNHPDGYHVGIEIDATSSDMFEALKNPETQTLLQDKDVYLWFGNEITGLTPDILGELNVEWHLPMTGTKESLNVATSVTAAGYVLKFGLPQLATGCE